MKKMVDKVTNFGVVYFIIPLYIISGAMAVHIVCWELNDKMKELIKYFAKGRTDF